MEYPELSEGWQLEESLFAVENAEKSAPRWSPFLAFIFLFLAALGSWVLIGLLIYLLSS